MGKQKLEHNVICGKIREKRARGQRLKFMDQLKDVMGGSTEEILRAVNNRNGWRNKCRKAVESWHQPMTLEKDAKVIIDILSSVNIT